MHGPEQDKALAARLDESGHPWADSLYQDVRYTKLGNRYVKLYKDRETCEKQTKRKAMTTAEIPHGKTRYDQGCRCPICTASWESHQRRALRVQSPPPLTKERHRESVKPVEAAPEPEPTPDPRVEYVPRKVETNPKCPHCSGSSKRIGHSNGYQRYKCLSCGRQHKDLDELHSLRVWIEDMGFEGSELKMGLMLASLPMSEIDAPSMSKFNGYPVSECQDFLDHAEAKGLVFQKERSFRSEWYEAMLENKTELATVGFVMDVFVLVGKAGFKATKDGMLYSMKE